ncbi:hypothetical protein DN052_02810 [Acidithiobacillus ferrooxidans]|uniref:Uncharacterized protein n=1 Tax=Acidithiobacillus ferrooxidans TaxID=920 RepID=A0A2W1KHU4_ACIFR|nr:hypothetical protein DN052_02810 [Acidithiobacillus ferrooxidans]
MWRSPNFLYGLSTIGRSWGVSINATRASHIPIRLPVCREAERIWKLRQNAPLVQRSVKVLGAETLPIDEATDKNKKTGINLIPGQNA